MATNLDKKISDIITGIIISLKAKGIKNLSVHKIVNYINDKYNVILDDDIVKDVLSNTAGVSEINNDEVLIGKAPDAEKDAEQAINAGSKTFDDGTGNLGGGAPMGGGDLSGGTDMPMDDNLGDGSDEMGNTSSEPTAEPDNSAKEEMDSQLSELDV